MCEMMQDVLHIGVCYLHSQKGDVRSLVTCCRALALVPPPPVTGFLRGNDERLQVT